jgi:hypothetical protein
LATVTTELIPLLDDDAGRRASRGELRRHLLTAPMAFVEGALANCALGEEEMQLLLRNPRVSPATLTRIGRDPRWTRKGEIRRLLVQHPQAPLSLARTLLGLLFWTEMLEVSVNLRVQPTIRRQAERMLGLRLEGMSTGEKISLARRAPRGVVAGLIHGDDPRILRSLLANPRLLEQDAVTIATSARTPPESLTHLAHHPNWGRRLGVRQALVRNTRTPVSVALRLLFGLPGRDLSVLVRDPAVPKIVRVGAERKLDGQLKRGPGWHD